MFLLTGVIDDNDIDIAARLLYSKYKVSTQMLHRIYSADWHDAIQSVNKKLYKDNISSYNALKGYNFCRLVVTKEGYDLFTGIEKQELRKVILNHLSDDKIKELYESFCRNGTFQARGYQISALARLKWVNGKRWARAFVKASGFPPLFAGIPQGLDKMKTIETIDPKSPSITLKEFQVELKEKMKEILSCEQDKTRCIVTLPTGCGKTRTAVEAFIEWMQPRFSEGKYLIWIAQSEELCDQAAECIKELWSQKEFTERLILIRYYKGSDLSMKHLEDEEYPNGGVVVASINQLYKRLEKKDPAIYYILQNTGAVIIDEAHKAVTSMYERLFNEAEKVCGPDLFPVCGLTATPGRNDNGENDTRKLVNLFEVTLIKPSLENDPEYDPDNPLEYFKKRKYLARATLEIIKSNKSFKCDEKQLRELLEAREKNDGLYELDDKRNRKLLRQLAIDKDRNLLIIKRLLDLPETSSTLVYTCTVEHAKYLASIMNMLGRRSRAVSSDTPTTERRRIIRDFRNQKIQFIFNYGVLTTGFDAPKTDTIVLCRPILSDILYEQIVGRGMRGPEFGGTERCLIIDFEDNIENLGLPLAYRRFEHYWDDRV